MELTLEEYKTLPAIPEDTIVPVTVEAITERESMWDDKDGNKKMQASFRFRVYDGEFKDRVIFGNCPKTFSEHPGCIFRAWVQEIMGADSLPVGFKLNTKDLEGLTCRVRVGLRVKEGADKKSVIETNYADDVIRDASVNSSADLAPF